MTNNVLEFRDVLSIFAGICPAFSASKLNIMEVLDD